MGKKIFTISVFTENNIGILNNITIIFTRRHLNLDSIVVSESEINDVFRFTFVLKTTQKQIEQIIYQLEKVVHVIKAFAHEESDILYQEIALYKIKIENLTTEQLEQIMRQHSARIITIDTQYIIIEKTGHRADITALFKALSPLGMLEFSSSGRVAIMKPLLDINDYLLHLKK
ncbi:MAG: acetolactate synthase small subunit [Chitinophagaceae bacterium]